MKSRLHRKISITLMIIMILSSFPGININKTYAMTDSQWERIQQELPPGTPRFSTNGYELNPSLWDKDSLIVYGNYGNVPNNDRDELGQWRYLGYTKDGQLFSNEKFTNDADSGRKDSERDWIYWPWEDVGVTSQSYPHGINEPNDWSKDDDFKQQVIEMTNKLGWKPKNAGADGFWGYAYIQSFPALNKTGSMRMWHRVNGALWYKTFTIPALERRQNELDITVTTEILTNDFTIEETENTITIPVKVTAKLNDESVYGTPHQVLYYTREDIKGWWIRLDYKGQTPHLWVPNNGTNTASNTFELKFSRGQVFNEERIIFNGIGRVEYLNNESNINNDTKQAVVYVKEPPIAEFEIHYNNHNVTDNENSPVQLSSLPYTVQLRDRTVTTEEIASYMWEYWDVSIGWAWFSNNRHPSFTVSESNKDVANLRNLPFRLTIESSGGAISTKVHHVYADLNDPNIIIPTPPPPPPPEPTPDPIELPPDISIIAPPQVNVFEDYTVEVTPIVPEGEGIQSLVLEANFNSGGFSNIELNDNAATENYESEGAVEYRTIITLTNGKSSEATAITQIVDNRSAEAIADLQKPETAFEGHWVYVRNKNKFSFDGNQYGAQQAYDLGIGNSFFYVLDNSEYMLDSVLYERRNYNRHIGYEIRYNEPGLYKTKIVADPLNAPQVSNVKSIRVYPCPFVNLAITGNKKSNRKMTLNYNATVRHPDYPLDNTKTIVTIEDIESGEKVSITNTNNEISENIKTRSLQVNNQVDFLIKTDIEKNYRATVYVEDTRGNGAEDNIIFTVQPDKPPVAQITSLDYFLRDLGNGKAEIILEDSSYSPDGDGLNREWLIAIDENHNNIIDDNEPYVEPATLEGFEDLSFGAAKKIKFIKTGVGMFDVKLKVKEHIPDGLTLPEFITDEDILEDNTSKEIVVDNVSPFVDFRLYPTKNMDIVFLAEEGSDELVALNNNITSFRMDLLEANPPINAKVEAIGHDSFAGGAGGPIKPWAGGAGGYYANKPAGMYSDLVPKVNKMFAFYFDITDATQRADNKRAIRYDPITDTEIEIPLYDQSGDESSYIKDIYTSKYSDGVIVLYENGMLRIYDGDLGQVGEDVPANTVSSPRLLLEDYTILSGYTHIYGDYAFKINGGNSYTGTVNKYNLNTMEQESYEIDIRVSPIIDTTSTYSRRNIFLVDEEEGLLYIRSCEEPVRYSSTARNKILVFDLITGEYIKGAHSAYEDKYDTSLGIKYINGDLYTFAAGCIRWREGYDYYAKGHVDIYKNSEADIYIHTESDREFRDDYREILGVYTPHIYENMITVGNSIFIPTYGDYIYEFDVSTEQVHRWNIIYHMSTRGGRHTWIYDYIPGIKHIVGYYKWRTDFGTRINHSQELVMHEILQQMDTSYMEALKNVNWRSGSERHVVPVNYNDISATDTQIQNIIDSNNAKYSFFGNTASLSVGNRFAMFSGGTFYNASVTDGLDSLRGDIINNQEETSPTYEFYYTKDDIVNYDVFYSDFEKDPSKASYWRYLHTPDTDGRISDHGVWRESPIAQFNKNGIYRVQHYQTDDTGVLPYDKDSNIAEITIHIETGDDEDPPPEPESYTPIAAIELSGSQKQNRKLTLNLNYSQNNRFSLSPSTIQWTITPVNGMEQDDIKRKAQINTSIDTLYKKSGRVKAITTFSDIYGNTGIAEREFDIIEDLGITGDITLQEIIFRDEDDKAKNEVTTIMNSPDDYIENIKYYALFDSNNDGDFEDEVKFSLGQFEDERYFELEADQGVGNYRIIAEVKEGFLEETIPEFITEEDYHTLTITKDFTVENIAPMYSVRTDKEVYLIGQEIQYISNFTDTELQGNVSLGYEDAENDPMYNLNIKYTQNTGFMPTPDETSMHHNIERETFLTILDRAGQYTIETEAIDNPKEDERFSSFRRHSGSDINTIIVHRPPVAQAMFEVVSGEDYGNNIYLEGTRLRIYDTSYDPDGFYVITNMSYRIGDGEYITINSGDIIELGYNGGIATVRVQTEDNWGAKDEQIYTLIVVNGLDMTAEVIPDIVPASESVLLRAVTNQYAVDVRVEILGENIPLYLAQETETQKVWETVYTIPETTQDAIYPARFYASSEGILEIRRDVYFMVHTPINLEPDMPAEMSITQTYDIKATTSRYANFAGAILYFNTPYASMIPLDNMGFDEDKKNWSIEHTVPSYIPEGEYTARYLACTPNGNSEIKDVTYNVYVNQAPSVEIIRLKPRIVYEGDIAYVHIQTNDPDIEPLNIHIELLRNGNKIWERNRTVTPVSGTYSVIRQKLKEGMANEKISLGNYQVRVIVTDAANARDQDQHDFTVKELGITGFVKHTDRWDENRKQYNLSKSGDENSPRTYDVFFPGEKFILEADTTVIDPDRVDEDGLRATQMMVQIIDMPYIVMLSPYNAERTKWTEELWDEAMLRWRSQDVIFRFTVFYSNGTIKRHLVPVRIENEQYWKYHRLY